MERGEGRVGELEQAPPLKVFRKSVLHRNGVVSRTNLLTPLIVLFISFPCFALCVYPTTALSRLPPPLILSLGTIIVITESAILVFLPLIITFMTVLQITVRLLRIWAR